MQDTLLKTGQVKTKRNVCRKKFLHYFPRGFQDTKYLHWERRYKLDAHLAFQAALNSNAYMKLLKAGKYEDIALTAVRIESKTNLLFSFEKMALRDALKSPEGAKIFAKALFNYVYGIESLQTRFSDYVEALKLLPRKQTRVVTWPLVTVFGFIANPKEHIFLKPKVTKIAAEKYRFDFDYSSTPGWITYKSLLDFSNVIKKDVKALQPADNIDLQSFIWVQGSEEYPD